MPLTLLATDLGDGTAAFAVAGSAGPGAVSASRFRGAVGPLVPASVWAFAADGTSPPVALTPGHYVCQAVAGADLSAPTYLAVADPEKSVGDAIHDAVADRVRLLALDRIGDNVLKQFAPNDLPAVYPCCFVTLPDGGGRERDEGGTNLRADWGYPVRVLLAHRADRLDPAFLPDFRRWRQQVRRAFDRQRLPGVPGVVQTVAEPGPIAVTFEVAGGAGGRGYHLTGSELTVRCVAREPRGFGE